MITFSLDDIGEFVELLTNNKTIICNDYVIRPTEENIAELERLGRQVMESKSSDKVTMKIVMDAVGEMI